MLDYFTMSDKIFLHGLKVFCMIGTLPRERCKKQLLIVDLEFPTSVQKAAKKDRLQDAINYKKIADRAMFFVASSRFYLIETLAERLASILLREFKLKSISLTIRKPAALRHVKCVGIAITRKR